MAVDPGAHNRITGRRAGHFRAISADALQADWEAIHALADIQDLAINPSRIATFELDLVADDLSWSVDAHDVLACERGDVETVLRGVIAPVVVSPTQGIATDYELETTVAAEGGERVVIVRAQTVREANDGSVAALFGAVVDVTGQRQAELELADLIDRYRLLVELSPDAIVVHEAGIVRYANSAAGRLSRTTVDALVGTSIVPFIHPDDLESTLDRIASLTEPGMVSEPTTVTLVAADGEPFLIESVSVRTTWEGRAAYQVIMRDVAEREEAKAAARAQARLVEAVSDAIVATDENGRVTSWNPAAARIFGWAREEALGRPVGDLGFPEEFVVEVGEIAAAGGQSAGEIVVSTKRADQVPVHTSIAAMRDELNRPGAVAVCSDQSLRHAAEAARARAEARFSKVVSALDEGIAVLSPEGSVQSVNPAAQHIFGRDGRALRAELSGGTSFEPLDADGTPLAAERWPITAARSRAASVSNQIVGVHRPSGQLVWLRANVHPLDDDRGGPPPLVCSFTDITAQRRDSAALSWAATHDELTGLPNRWSMNTQIDAALENERDDIAVLFCDLDRFKDVNDSLGHRVGDVVLCSVADRLRGLMRPGDVLGRLGGDEFLILCTPVTAREAGLVGERIIYELSRPFEIEVDGTPMAVSLGASVGVALASVDSADVGELLQAADAAVYKAKARGRNRVEVFDRGLREEARRRLDIREDLRRALDERELEVHYQPLFHTAGDPELCSVAGFEALVRWNHRVRGPQAPAEFVPVAEDTGLISMLGAFVLHEACGQTVRWHNAGHDVHVSVNLSARQLSDPHIVPSVAAALTQSGLDPASLWLELTESALAEEGLDAVAVLSELVDMGVQISIDDFGTGYSSLGRLRHYPVAALKVDQSFVADMTASTAADGHGDGGAIVEAAISLGHRLGLSVVAEGVETAEQFEKLSALGCDLFQGFLLGEPVPPDEVNL